MMDASVHDQHQEIVESKKSNVLKILLVEDNKIDALLIKEMISEAGEQSAGDVRFEVIHKASGAKILYPEFCKDKM
jgi:hypothetical protein